MNEDIQFLKELQEELNTQDIDCQAAPRYWVVGDYQMLPCPDGYQEKYHVHMPNGDYQGEIGEVLEDIKEEKLDDMAEESQLSFEGIECEESAIEWIREYLDKEACLIPMREEHFVHPNTMFLTKQEAKKHIELNHYHYSPKVHAYAMTALRAPKIERLMDILQKFDWDSLKVMTRANNGMKGCRKHGEHC